MNHNGLNGSTLTETLHRQTTDVVLEDSQRSDEASLHRTGID